MVKFLFMLAKNLSAITPIFSQKVFLCYSQAIRDAFKRFDKDGSGTLSHAEVRQLVKECGAFKGANLDEMASELISSADRNNDGAISLDEFLKVCS